ncbi:MAG: cyclic nucleotide-binding domain-containing protein [Deltaproteobacteria bacterium]|nr:cyclic nucleotide-binding domain-containing protein [Deltaproteobacteria bacterium]MBN2674312.1 cyclic nucleotide-binding domain-containing protein [Deltaproteobacteria bacterium]
MIKSRFFKESKLRKYKDKASDLVEKGKYKKALSIYRDILEAFPDDTTIMLKVGDLCKKLEMFNEAIAVYVTAAEYHAQSGRLLQAIAVCRLILEIDKNHTGTQKRLAALYAQKYGSSEHSGVIDIHAKEESPAAKTLTLTDDDVVTDEEFVEEANSDSVSASVAAVDTHEESVDVNADSAQRDERESDIAELSDDDIEALDTTMPVHLDFSNIVSADSELSEVYDLSDIEEYKRELEAEGLLASGADFTELDETQETRLTGITQPKNMMLTISKPPTAAETLPPIPLFSSMDEDALLELINDLPLRHYDALETVVKEGEHGDSFFIIATGSVEIFKNNESLATLEEGAFFGEMGMIFPGPRQATVVTAEPCDLFEVSKSQLEEMTTRHPRVGQVLLEFAEQRLLDNLLNTSPIFAPFSTEDRQSLMDKFEPYMLEADTVVIEEGGMSAGLYLIVAGEAEVSMSGNNGEVIQVSRLKGNDIFGEVSLLSRSGAIATVTTVTECRVLVLPKGRFDELIMTHPQVLELVAAISDERVATLNRLKSELSQRA